MLLQKLARVRDVSSVHSVKKILHAENMHYHKNFLIGYGVPVPKNNVTDLNKKCKFHEIDHNVFRVVPNNRYANFKDNFRFVTKDHWKGGLLFTEPLTDAEFNMQPYPDAIVGPIRDYYANYFDRDEIELNQFINQFKGATVNRKDVEELKRLVTFIKYRPNKDAKKVWSTIETNRSDPFYSWILSLSKEKVRDLFGWWGVII